MSDQWWKLRPMRDSDRALVHDHWRRSWECSRRAYYPGRLRQYIATQSKVIDLCLERSEVWCVSPTSDEDYVMGWACIEPPSVAHYVYVRPEYRGHGFARALLAPLTAERVYMTHDPGSLPDAAGTRADALVRSLKKNGKLVQLSPWLMLTPKEGAERDE